MIALQIHITAGPQAGTRLQLTQSPATFGRAPENTLILDLSTVSRNHGELRFEDDQWWLINLSQNGTKVGRKRVTKKPRLLSDGASIIIGDEEVFRVHHVGDTAPPAANEPASTSPAEQGAPQPGQAAPGTGARGRSKLWILLAIWFGLCIGIFVLLYTTIGQKDGDGPSRTTLVSFDSAHEIRQILKQEVERATPDNYRYTENIAKGRTAYNRKPRELYEAYRYFRSAMRYLPASQKLDHVDRQRYDLVLDELSALIFERYQQASDLHQQGAHEEAIDEIDRLSRQFPPSSTGTPDPAQEELQAIIMALRGQASRAMNAR